MREIFEVAFAVFWETLNWIPDKIYEYKYSKYAKESRRKREVELKRQQEEDRKYKKNRDTYFILVNERGTVYKSKRLYESISSLKEAVTQIKQKNPDFKYEIYECILDRSGFVPWTRKGHVDFYAIGQKYTDPSFTSSYVHGKLYICYDDVSNALKDLFDFRIEANWWSFVHFPIPVYLIGKLDITTT